jgi:hypothetical protein
MFCLTLVRLGQVSLGVRLNRNKFFSQKRDFLPVELTPFLIVEQNPVKHPNSIPLF